MEKIVQIAARFKASKTPEEIFGKFETMEELQSAFKSLAKICHPDMWPFYKDKHLAERTMVVLNRWHEKAKLKFKPKPIDAAKGMIISAKNAIKYEVLDTIASGDICDLFLARRTSFNSKQEKNVVLKCVRDRTNNDLMNAEMDSLKLIHQTCAGKKSLAHIPIFCEQLKLGLTCKNDIRNHNVLMPMDGFFSLKQVCEAYPKGVDLRDAAWMFNRLIGAMLMAHQSGIVHGAITPGHFFIHPADHNGMLIDWCYSVKAGGTIKAIVPEYKSHYPSDVLLKLPASYGIDICMACACLVRLLGHPPEIMASEDQMKASSVPMPLWRLIKACMLGRAHRMNEVWNLYESFNQILEKLYGEKKFRHFEMPSVK